MKTETIQIALVDDHNLVRQGIIRLIDSFKLNHKICFETGQAKDFLNYLTDHQEPDLAIVDINMPDINGFELVEILQEKNPHLKILVMTMLQDEKSLIRMLKLGVRGYLSKDTEPEILQEAIETIMRKGYYYTDFLTGKLITAIQGDSGNTQKPVLNQKELQFIQLACSEDTYKEIADKMCLSVKTIDGYRNTIFEKFGIKSRVGLVLYAIKEGIYVI